MSDRDETETEAEVVPSPADGVISGESRPPDEHTRRVAAAKKRARADETHTMQKAWDQEELRASVQEPTVSDAPPSRSGPQRTFRSGKETPFGPPRTPVQEDNPRRAQPERAQPDQGPVRPTPPPERSELVRAHGTEPAHAAFSAADAPPSAPPPSQPPSSSPPSDPPAAAPPPADAPSATMSTREYADRSIRHRRKERDRRAEKTALRWVIGFFVLAGAGGYVLINSDLVSGPEETHEPRTSKQDEHTTAPKTEPKSKSKSSTFDETPDIPALRDLASGGLTIAAEGIPEVTASDQTQAGSLAAATETCRFAFSVWEFSPNKRFRFLTTCGAFEDQVMVGAYSVQGSRVRMSPLIDGPVTIVSEFEVEKPSRMKTAVNVTQGDRAIALEVNQRVTVLRAGLEGEGFRDTFAPKNSLHLPGEKKREDGAQQQHRTGKDPLLDLIKKPR